MNKYYYIWKTNAINANAKDFLESHSSVASFSDKDKALKKLKEYKKDTKNSYGLFCLNELALEIVEL